MRNFASRSLNLHLMHVLLALIELIAEMFDFCLRTLLSFIIVPGILLANFIPCVQGNTEIVNFAASLAESPNMTFPDW